MSVIPGLVLNVIREPHWLSPTLNPWGWTIARRDRDSWLVVAAGPAKTEEEAWAAGKARLPEVHAEETARRRAAYTGLAGWAFTA